MKRGGKSGPRQPGGGKQTAGSRKKRSPPGRGGRQDRFGGRNDKPRLAEERGPRSDRPRGKPVRSARVEDRPRPSLRDTRETMPAKPVPTISPALAAATKVQTVTVTADENGMRVDRFFEARFPGLSFSHIQRIVRKGEVRVDGKRVETKSRLEAGQTVRIPPLQLAAPRVREDSPQVLKDREYLRSITLAEDDDVLVLNKPMGLAVQGGSGTTRHVDGLLETLRGPGVDAQRPRLVHRLDKDTAGCLLVAKTRFAAAALAKTFRTRSARKIYWALVAGVPKP